MFKRNKLPIVLVSILLLLGTASVSLSLPAPAPMTLARTRVDLVVQSPITMPTSPSIEAAVAIASDFSVTTSATTTSAIPLYGLIPWQITNESGAAATLTFYNALSIDGTAMACYDEDSVAVGTITIGDDCSQQLPTALSGCTVLVITGAAAADHFTVVCKR